MSAVPGGNETVSCPFTLHSACLELARWVQPATGSELGQGGGQRSVRLRAPCGSPGEGPVAAVAEAYCHCDPTFTLPTLWCLTFHYFITTRHCRQPKTREPGIQDILPGLPPPEARGPPAPALPRPAASRPGSDGSGSRRRGLLRDRKSCCSWLRQEGFQSPKQ